MKNSLGKLQGKVILSTVPKEILIMWINGQVPSNPPIPQTRGDLLRQAMRDRGVA